MQLLRLLGALFLLILAGAAPPAQGGVAIVGADVLPMTGTARLSDQTVLVEGDQVVAVGPRARVEVPPGWRTIEARGKTLMPGLVDMHVHLAPETGRPGDAAQRALAVMLGHGVTTARGMAGSPANLEVRDAIERGELAGPRFYAAAPGLNLNSAKTPEEATAKVAAAKQAGYDLIKSHHLTDLAVWEAVRDEARRQRLPTAGHVTNQVGLARAIAARQQVEHLDGAIFALLPADAPERQIEFGQIPPPPVMQAAARASDADIDALARRLASANSYQVPTLSLFEKIADIGTSAAAMRAAPATRYIPEPVLDQWAQQKEGLAQAGFTAADGAAFRDLRRRIVRAFDRAGIPIMAGSDTAQAFHIWGLGLIEEIEALHAAGLPRMEALKAATIVPRDYFRSLPNGGSARGWKADFGTVEKGARADLILLGGDPSRDLAALRALDTVIAGGKVYDRTALDAMLTKAAADAKAVKPPLAFSASVYVMRHLHKGEGDDPPLSAEGRANAERLAALLAADPPAAIYVTPYRRTRETAAPLAAKLGLTPKVYDPRDNKALIEQVAKEKGTVLIVGHSNTVPAIVADLGGARPADLGEGDYGDLFLVEGPERKVTRRSLSQGAR
jgi:imidazolonepropionase-like amidohydrolase